MNIKASFQYQLINHKTSIIIFYLITLTIYTLLFISVASALGLIGFNNDATGNLNGTSFVTGGSIGGMSAATMIFIFIASLNSFKENFKMLTQNGISRKTIFLGRLATTGALAILLAVIDHVILLVYKALASITNDHLRCTSLFEQSYPIKASTLSPLALNAQTFVYNLLFYLFFMAAGYFITILFYRLNNLGKTLISAGVPIMIFVIIPILDYYVTDHKIGDTFEKIMEYSFGSTTNQPIHAMITAILLFLVFSVFSWLLMRRASVRE